MNNHNSVDFTDSSIVRMKTVCVFCSREVPDDTQPETFRCCGEVGHVHDVAPNTSTPERFVPGHFYARGITVFAVGRNGENVASLVVNQDQGSHRDDLRAAFAQRVAHALNVVKNKN